MLYNISNDMISLAKEIEQWRVRMISQQRLAKDKQSVNACIL